MSRRCTSCGEDKLIDAFSIKINATGLRHSKCRPCRNLATKKTQCPEKKRADRYKRQFGITLADYDQILADQNNGCAVCGKSPEENGKRLAVDHNHKTGEVRGLLCSPCNVALGLLNDNPATLRLATRYLEERGHYGDD